MAKQLRAPLIQARKCIRGMDRIKQHPDILANAAYLVGRYIGGDCISYQVGLAHLIESVNIFNDGADLPMFRSIIIQNLKAGAQHPASGEMIDAMVMVETASKAERT